MKNYVLPLLVVILVMVSCKKPEFEGVGDKRVTLSVVDIKQTAVLLNYETNFECRYKEEYIINSETGQELTRDYNNTNNIRLINLNPNTTYTVHAIVRYDSYRYVQSSDITFTTE